MSKCPEDSDTRMIFTSMALAGLCASPTGQSADQITTRAIAIGKLMAKQYEDEPTEMDVNKNQRELYGISKGSTR